MLYVSFVSVELHVLVLIGISKTGYDKWGKNKNTKKSIIGQFKHQTWVFLFSTTRFSKSMIDVELFIFHI